MFDIWWGDIELTTLVLIISVVFLFPLQLYLCFKVRSRAIRLLPVVLLFVPTVILAFMGNYVNGWDRLGYQILAAFSGFMLLICGAAWGIWAIVEYRRNKKN